MEVSLGQAAWRKSSYSGQSGDCGPAYRLSPPECATGEGLQGDALEIIDKLAFDVLIGSLPHAVTESLLKLLPGLSFRTAVLAVGESTDLDSLDAEFSWSEVTRITGNDFLPPQSSVSRIVKVIPVGRD